MIRNGESTQQSALSTQPRNVLAVAAFLALTLPLAFIASGTADKNSVPTAAADNATPQAAYAATQTAPVDEPAPLPVSSANQNSAKPAQPGQAVPHILVPHSGNARILISIPDREMAVLKDGKVHRIYPVAVGAKVSPSPAGQFHIAKKIVAPSYSHNGTVVAPGKGNPLGSRWMGLDKEHYGIHGTNMPQSIGHAASHGCIRMRKHDVEELFEVASVGDVVEIHDTRTEELAQIFGAGPVVEIAKAGTTEKKYSVLGTQYSEREGEQQ